MRAPLVLWLYRPFRSTLLECGGRDMTAFFLGYEIWLRNNKYNLSKTD